jgi:nitrogen-specific signal transduction histidine kinase
MVDVVLAEDDNSVRIMVSDNGSGVPESVQKTMFLPFVSEGKHSGTGLGLTLAEHIATEHGGYIFFERTVEKLTVFSLVLPKAASPVSPTAPDRSTANYLRATR